MRVGFGAFELDDEAHTLCRDGSAIAVQPKVFALISYLIRNRARFVTKAELLAALWPGEHVTDSALYVLIRGARVALDQQSTERPISMVRGAGYRFIADVRELASLPQREGSAPARASAVEPLVGRERVLAALAGALDDCVLGRGRLVILGGEPGIGKTRCARELGRLAEARGVPALLSRCLEQEGVPALWPFIQLLRQAASHNPEAAPEIERVLSELQPRDSQGAREGAPVDRSIERFWSFDRVARALRDAAAPTGLVIVIDDLQWADDSSLQQLERCTTDLEQTRILIVATLREPRPSGEPPRERALRRLSRAATMFELSGLSETETEELVRQVKGGAQAAKLAAGLYRKSAGNPFFLCELLRSLPTATDELASRVDDGVDEGVVARRPGVIRDMILGRLEGLEHDALTVLRAASALGTEVEVATLRAVVDLSAERFLRALEPLLEQRLLARATSHERCTFSHDLVREVVYAQLEEVERVRYHRRAAEALETRTNASPVEVAHHFHRALADGVHERALHHAIRAGAHCMDTLAFETAARCYRWGLAALDFHRAVDPRVRAELMLQLGVAILAIGRSTQAVEVLRDAALLADRGDYGDLLARAATWLRYNVALAPLRDPFALRMLERARALLGPEEHELRAQVLSRLAWIWPHCEDMAKCKALAAESLSLARRSGSGAILLDALTATLYSQSGPDDTDSLLDTADEIFTLERRAGHVGGWASTQAQFLRYHALLQRGDRAQADRALAELSSLAERIKLREKMLLSDRLKTTQQVFYAGHLDEAAAQFAEQYARGQSHGLAYADLYYGVQLLSLQWEREGLHELPALPSSDGWDLTHTPGYRATRVFVAARAETSSKELGHELDQVLDEEIALLARADFAAIPRDLNYLFSMCLLAHAVFVRKDRARAQRLYELLAPYAACNTVSLLSQTAGSVAHFLGELAQLLGHSREATRHFEEALALNERMSYALWAARTKLAYAELLMHEPKLGGQRRAQQLLREVAATARSLGLGPLLKRVTGLLAA